MAIRTTLIAGAAGLAILLVAPLAQAAELNIYSSRHYQTDERLYSDFTEQTGIEINRIDGNGDQLIERLKAEGQNTPADIFITVDAGRLWRADEGGLFQPTDSALLVERVPEHLRHPDGHWFGFSTRARLIFVNPDLVDPNLVKRYEDLADPRLKGLVCIRSSSNIYNLSLLASLIEANGEAAAKDWAEGVVANFARPPQGGDTDQLKGAASGECGIAVANSYYYIRMLKSDDPEIRAMAEKLVPIFPNQDDRGTHVNVSGAGVVKGAANSAEAVRFLEYLTSPAAQEYFANGNNEYPVVEGVEETTALASLGSFKIDPVSVEVYGKNQPTAQKIYDQVGWP